jgi:hypothetical protein
VSIQLLGDAMTVGEVDPNTRALRVDLRAADVDGGEYAVSLVSGTMPAGLGANSEVFHFRWTDPSYVAVIERVRLWAGGVVGFTAGFCTFDLVVARRWSAIGVPTGTRAVLTGDAGKKRYAFPSSRTESDMIEIAGSQALSMGTKTLDTQPIGSAGGSTRGTGIPGDKLVSPSADLFRADGRRHPLVLRENEGLVIRATMPASGTWTFGVDVEWAEVTTY